MAVPPTCPPCEEQPKFQKNREPKMVASVRPTNLDDNNLTMKQKAVRKMVNAERGEVCEYYWVHGFCHHGKRCNKPHKKPESPDEKEDADLLHREWYDGTRRGAKENEWAEYFQRQYEKDGENETLSWNIRKLRDGYWDQKRWQQSGDHDPEVMKGASGCTAAKPLRLCDRRVTLLSGRARCAGRPAAAPARQAGDQGSVRVRGETLRNFFIK